MNFNYSKEFKKDRESKWEDSIRETNDITESIETKNYEPENKNFDKGLKGPWRASRAINMRDKASMDGSIITIITPDGTVICTGNYETDTNGDKWLKIKFNNNEGYAMAKYFARR